MQKLFGPDSPFMRCMSRVADLMMLNFFFLLTCIPVFTIGAAVTAMYTVCFRFGTERESGVVGSFFRAFKDNFKQATLMWLVVLLLGAFCLGDLAMFYVMSGKIRYVYLVFAFLFVLLSMVSGFAFPLMSQFDNRNKVVLYNALILSIGYFPRAVVIVVLNLLPFVLLLTNVVVFFQMGFLWAILYFSVAAYLNSLLLKKVFAPYMGDQEVMKL